MTRRRYRGLLERLRSLDDLFRASPHAEIVGQVHPSYPAIRIDEELCRARNVMALDTFAGIHQIVALDRNRVGIGQKGELISVTIAQGTRDFGLIHADGYRPDSQTLKRFQILLDTPQLGVTERSPVPSIEDQEDATRWLAAIIRSSFKLR